MFWFITAFVVAVCIGVAMWREPRTTYRNRKWVEVRDAWEGFGAFFVTAIIGFIVSVLISLLIGVVVYDSEYTKSYQFDIRASGDDSAIEGRWGVIHRRINEEYRYVFYRDQSDGSIDRGWIPEERTKLFDDAPEGEAWIEVYEDRNVFGPFAFHPAGEKHYEIHVPPGSVTTEHNYDLED